MMSCFSPDILPSDIPALRMLCIRAAELSKDDIIEQVHAGLLWEGHEELHGTHLSSKVEATDSAVKLLHHMRPFLCNLGLDRIALLFTTTV